MRAILRMRALTGTRPMRGWGTMLRREALHSDDPIAGAGPFAVLPRGAEELLPSDPAELAEIGVEVLPEGTGYLTDLGMTGPANAVLGIAPEQSIGKFLGDPPRRYEAAMGAAKLEGAIFEVDSDTGRCRDVRLVRLR